MKYNTWESLQNNIPEFAKNLLASLDELGIREKCEKLELDHFCVRLSNITEIDQLKLELANIAKNISTVDVNGRPISIFQLDTPLQVGLWSVKGLEVPNPKQNNTYADGWEHVEFVLPASKNTMSEIRNSFEQLLPNLNNDKYRYSENEPQTDDNEIPNPTISIRVNNIGIKFHANSIQKVVGYTK